MSKPLSGLFHGTIGERAFLGDAEQTISERTAELDLREHPVERTQLSAKQRRDIARKIRNRTATREEYEAYEWDRRFRNRRNRGVRRFWAQERERLLNGEPGTRNWTAEQREAIVNRRPVRYGSRNMQAHHSYSASRYPHLADRGEVIYPATYLEHLMGWHGGNYRKSKAGRRVRYINEF